jgi:type II secretory ATPase GspE/PulE/Tfp pilus assembly ATPase PilB-like protein
MDNAMGAGYFGSYFKRVTGADTMATALEEVRASDGGAASAGADSAHQSGSRLDANASSENGQDTYNDVVDKRAQDASADVEDERSPLEQLMSDEVLVALLHNKHVSSSQALAAVKRHRTNRTGDLWRSLLEVPGVDPDVVFAEAARGAKVPFARLDDRGKAEETLRLLMAKMPGLTLDRLQAINLAPVRTGIHAATGRQVLVFATHDPGSPAIRTFLRDVPMLAVIRYAHRMEARKWIKMLADDQLATATPFSDLSSDGAGNAQDAPLPALLPSIDPEEIRQNVKSWGDGLGRPADPETPQLSAGHPSSDRGPATPAVSRKMPGDAEPGGTQASEPFSPASSLVSEIFPAAKTAESPEVPRATRPSSGPETVSKDAEASPERAADQAPTAPSAQADAQPSYVRNTFFHSRDQVGTVPASPGYETLSDPISPPGASSDEDLIENEPAIDRTGIAGWDEGSVSSMPLFGDEDEWSGPAGDMHTTDTWPEYSQHTFAESNATPGTSEAVPHDEDFGPGDRSLADASSQAVEDQTVDPVIFPVSEIPLGAEDDATSTVFFAASEEPHEAEPLDVTSVLARYGFHLDESSRQPAEDDMKSDSLLAGDASGEHPERLSGGANNLELLRELEEALTVERLEAQPEAEVEADIAYVAPAVESPVDIASQDVTGESTSPASLELAELAPEAEAAAEPAPAKVDDPAMAEAANVIAKRDRVVAALLKKEIVQPHHVHAASERQQAEKSKEPLWRLIVQDKRVDREAVFSEAAQVYAFSVARIDHEKPDIEFIRTVTRTFTEEHQDALLKMTVLPWQCDLDRKSGAVKLVFITHDPTRPEVNRLLQQMRLERFEVRYAPEAAVKAVLLEAFPKKNEFLERMGEKGMAFDLGTSFDESKGNLIDEDALEAEISRSTLINLFEATLVEAVRQGSSDIHIYPNANKQIEIHFRTDGRLAKWHTEDKVHPEALLAVIKDNAMNVDRFERDAAQDGFIQRWIDDALIRFRVSVLPIANASQEIRSESIVIRVLDDRKVITDLTKLGLNGTSLDRFEMAISQPHGMVILTGPTGSGKSTTLVAALHQVVTPEVNVLTVEDPVEYIIPGVRQIKLNYKLGLEDALRAILRHDPDVVMVGEMRDKQTAELAIKLANTGHLTFSTLHTNDAPSAVSRLYKMGVEPFLIAYAINLVVAQRLIRRICPTCKQVDNDPDHIMLSRLGFTDEQIAATTFYTPSHSQSCRTCKGIGYKGRSAITEALYFSRAIRHLIVESTRGIEEEAIREKAVEEGMLTLQDSARMIVLEGQTSVQEMMRVTTTEG